MGNSNNKFKMESYNTNSLSIGMSNIDINEIEIQPWIKNMSTKELQITIREIANIDNYGEFYPGGYVLNYMEIVNDNNRHEYERNFAIFLNNISRFQDNQITRNDIMNMTIRELIDFCKNNNIHNYSNKNKSQLQHYIINFFNL
tara:strand:- start:32 stop:463 length:432 start_codon:yes stop_codon:yes gene_type:complete